MSRLLKMAEDKMQQRSISVVTFNAGPGKALVEGRLVDRRYQDVFLINGEKRPIGLVHDIIVYLLIDTASFIIEDVEVELLEIPMKECSEVKDSLRVLKNMCITKGFTKKMKSLLGGSRSCTHLRELLEAMAPAVFQGLFTINAGNEEGIRSLMADPRIIQSFTDSIVDSCHIWRKDGPEFSRIQNLLNG